MTCEDVRLHLGGYVLAGLEPGEDEQVRDHLAVCAVCRHEHARLRDLPDLLALAADAPPVPPPTLREQVLAQASAARGGVGGQHLRQRVWQLAAALLVGVVLGGAAVWYLRPPEPDPAVRVALEAVGTFTATGALELRPTANGLAVHLQLEDLPPLEGDEVYEAWLAPPEGRPLSVGTFRPDSEGEASVVLSAAGPIERYGSVWITLEPDFRDPAHDGPTVVDGRLPSG